MTRTVTVEQRGEIVMPGTVVKPYGVVGAVGVIEGERYYWLTDERGSSCSVSMIPASEIEPRAALSRTKASRRARQRKG